MYGCTRLALDRPRPHERDLHGQVVEVLRLRPQQALHLRAALDLEVADRVGALDLREDVAVVERDPREVDRLAAAARDLLDAVLDRREHPEAEQVDLQEAGVGARVLVPLAELAAGHRRRLHGDELDRAAATRSPSRPGAARCGAAGRRSRASARAKARQRGRRARAASGARELLGDRCRVPAVGDAREPLELGEREAERLADVADRAAAR
jgi:hypothetical protein